MEQKKYKGNSLQSNMVDIIYDTIVGYTHYPQLKPLNLSYQWVESAKGEITLQYKLDEIFTDKGIEEIEPKDLEVIIKIDVK